MQDTESHATSHGGSDAHSMSDGQSMSAGRPTRSITANPGSVARSVVHSVARHLAFRQPMRTLTGRLALTVLLVALAFSAWPSRLAQSAPSQQRGAFLATFDGTPSSPAPWHGAGWDISIHSRDRETWKDLEPMPASHGGDCSAPPNAHMMNQYDDAVYHCNNHIMTAINASGYGLIYLTPNQQVDLSGGEAVVKFDLSTLRTSTRDWVDIWLTPYEDHLQLPLDTGLPDLNGEPRQGVHIKLGNSTGGSNFTARVFHDAQVEELQGKWFTGYEELLVPSAVRRDPFELRISRTSLKFGMPTYNHWWIDSKIADLGWDRAIVQFGHHSYTPAKECQQSSCGPNTWHWDNIGIEPAVPFTIIPAEQRWLNEERGTTVTFQAPAPEGSNLRFVAIGNDVSVSYNGGASWQAARPRPIRGKLNDGAFQSYWIPMPAGVNSVMLRAEGWWGGAWNARDFSIWSLEVPGEGSPAPTGGEAGPSD
jgi:hypothetical protein